METPLQRADAARRARDRRAALWKVLLAMGLSVLAYLAGPTVDPWASVGEPSAGDARSAVMGASDGLVTPARSVAARRPADAGAPSAEGFEPAVTSTH